MNPSSEWDIGMWRTGYMTKPLSGLLLSGYAPGVTGQRIIDRSVRLVLHGSAQPVSFS